MPNHGFGRCDGHHKMVDFTPKSAACVKSFTYTRSAGAKIPTRSRQKGIQMRKISFVIAAAALILTAGVGGWVASTTARDRAVNVENFRAGTPAGGGLFVMPPVS
jgi:hypothetical protein